MQGKVEDAGGLTRAKDDNAAMQFPDRGTFLSIFEKCSNISVTDRLGNTVVLFTPLPPYETPETIDMICDSYNRVLDACEIDPLILIPVVIHDFRCVHPFNDGNGRMSRLLTTLLLYRSGHHVGKYISLESKIVKIKIYATMR